MAYQSVNPATGMLTKTYADHSDADLEKALATAHALYQSEWSKGPIQPRLDVLHRLADLIEVRAAELSLIPTREMGKLIGESRMEVGFVASIARFYADNSERFLAPSVIGTVHGDAWVESHPIGVIVAVEPWNMPYYQLMRVLAPNLAIGNPVIAKHAPIVPEAAEAFEALVRDAGAPAGAWTNLFISNEQVSGLIADDRVEGVAFTGSERTGAILAAQAGQKIKKSVLELGSNDVFVVLDDADVDAAVKAGAASRLWVAGQICMAAKRFIVDAKVAPAFLAKFTEAFERVVIGDPMDERTMLGPLSSIAARDNLAGQVERAVAHGARVHLGDRAVSGPGAFYEPTILTGVRRDNPAYFEEFFGPVAQIYVVNGDEEAVALANDSRYGLASSIFSTDIDRAKRVGARIETGAVWINTMTSSAPELPFGGVKRSGYGRELSELGIREFINHKLVLVGKAA
ncbi:NAD-dependent succinate-semialdehyde dehydrogenase [Burkholderia gladioli]|uniref:NAD-dependent succinate-semialdehyde dehydrogenase n=1 Tax=Burkholderia gladioli TaxID=28095 RepID=UPI003D36D91A